MELLKNTVDDQASTFESWNRQRTDEQLSAFVLTHHSELDHIDLGIAA